MEFVQIVSTFHYNSQNFQNSQNYNSEKLDYVIYFLNVYKNILSLC